MSDNMSDKWNIIQGDASGGADHGGGCGDHPHPVPVSGGGDGEETVI